MEVNWIATENKRLPDMEILRASAIIIIVLFHWLHIFKP